MAEEAAAAEVLPEILGTGGEALSGVEAINAAAPGSIAKGLTDAEVAGSVFAPAAAGAAAGGAAGTGAGGTGGEGGVAGGAAAGVEGAAPAVIPPTHMEALPIPGGAPGATGAPVSVPGAAPEVSATAAPASQVTTTAPSASTLPVGGAGEWAGTEEATGQVAREQAATDAYNEAATTGKAAPPPPPTPSGVEKAFTSLGLYDPVKGAIGPNALPLGVLGASAAMNANAGKSLQKQLAAAGAPARATSERLLSEGAGGDVPPAIMAQFDRSYNDKVNEIAQRYANMGRDAKTDSAAQAEMAKAKDARDAQVAQYAGNLTSQGLQAAQVAAGPTTQAAMAGAQQDQALQQSMASALQTLAVLNAMQGSKQGAPAPAA